MGKREIVFALIFCGMLYTQQSPTAQTLYSITLSKPSGHPTWNTGETYKIQWTSSPTVDEVDIKLWDPRQGYIETIATDAPSRKDESGDLYSWTIPFDIKDYDKYQIELLCYCDGERLTVSAEISIETKYGITITEPNSNTIWNVGSTEMILWDIDGPGGRVRIDLLKDEVKVLELHDNAIGDGDYTWDIDSNLVSGSDYKIKMHDKTYGGDFFSGEFEIVGSITSQSSISNGEKISSSTSDAKDAIIDDNGESTSENNALSFMTLSPILSISILILIVKRTRKELGP